MEKLLSTQIRKQEIMKVKFENNLTGDSDQDRLQEGGIEGREFT